MKKIKEFYDDFWKQDCFSFLYKIYKIKYPVFIDNIWYCLPEPPSDFSRSLLYHAFHQIQDVYC